ncbi:MAG: YdcF family protein [Spirochaetales bacterium]|jgi:uncharacterized SAM-binding protein YcdF (DUF218 family)|nr:YdcF family protein [Spirochaetales bacterium]
MVFLSKICTVLILPPGCFVSGLLIFALFFPRRRRIAMTLAAALLYALSIEPVKDVLLKPLEDFYPPLDAGAAASAADAQALVVLGGGTVQASPEAGEGRDALAPGALKRAVYAFSLRDIFPGAYIAAGGRVFDYGQEAETDVMGRLLVSLGLPEERVLKEGESRNTWQNAENIARLFGYKKIILVTSAYHMRRSVFCFENNGFSVIPAPADYRCARNSPYDIFSFLPSPDAFLGTYEALHEYAGLLYYRLVYP